MRGTKNNRGRKSIAIIGEGLTEYRYIDDLRTTERYRFSLAPGIPKHSDIDDIVKLARDRVNTGYDYVLCLVDMDVISGSHEKMEHYKSLQKDNPDVIFVESSPCTEYWFLIGIYIENYTEEEQKAREEAIRMRQKARKTKLKNKRK